MAESRTLQLSLISLSPPRTKLAFFSKLLFCVDVSLHRTFQIFCSVLQSIVIFQDVEVLEWKIRFWNRDALTVAIVMVLEGNPGNEDTQIKSEGQRKSKEDKKLMVLVLCKHVNTCRVYSFGLSNQPHPYMFSSTQLHAHPSTSDNIQELHKMLKLTANQRIRPFKANNMRMTNTQGITTTFHGVIFRQVCGRSAQFEWPKLKLPPIWDTHY